MKPMKRVKFLLIGLLGLGSVPLRSEVLVAEDFAYEAGDLSGRSGGTGWTGEWMDGGNSIAVVSEGLGFVDRIGNTLLVSGGAVNTSDGETSTTISGRETGLRGGELWISMLIQPVNASSDFAGVSFYRDDLTLPNARFAIEHSGNKNLRLTRRTGGGPTHTESFGTTVGETVLAVLRLIPGAGGSDEEPDLIEVYFNPRLDEEPFIPHAYIGIDGLEFDRIRIAGANARAMLVDEIRIGESYADVVPHVPAENPDSDGDGLTDAQEAILGTDPEFPDTALVVAIRANPSWFGLHSTAEIETWSVGRIDLEPISPTSINAHVRVKRPDGTLIETITRPIPVDAPRGFLRVRLPSP